MSHLHKTLPPAASEWKAPPGDYNFASSQRGEETRRTRMLARQSRADAGHMIQDVILKRERLAEDWLEERLVGGTGLGRDMSRSERRTLLNRLLDKAVRLLRADMANVQLVDHGSGALLLEAQCGFFRPFLQHFACVQDAGTACHAALKRGVWVVVPDVTESPIFRGTSSLDVICDAGARAVQSVPLVGRSGRILGVLSTHYRRPGHPYLPNSAARNRLISQFVHLLDDNGTLPRTSVSYDRAAF